MGKDFIEKNCSKEWGYKCAVTNSRIEHILIASHILPWSKSNNAQKELDIGNGILLSPNLDALFDRHIISFDASGRIMLSTKVSKIEYQGLNISEELRLRHVYLICSGILKNIEMNFLKRKGLKIFQFGSFQ